MKAWFDDNNVLRFAEGLTDHEVDELAAMLGDAFNKGTVNGYQQGYERGLAGHAVITPAQGI